MLEHIQQVLRSLVLLRRQSQRPAGKSSGGLLVLLWGEPATPQSLNWTVVEDLRERGGDDDCPRPSPQPDPEELCAFADLHGPLRLLLTFQTKLAAPLGPDWCSPVEEFLRTFSLANAGIHVHFTFSFNQQRTQREFRPVRLQVLVPPVQHTQFDQSADDSDELMKGKIKTKVALTNQPPLCLDVTSHTQPPEWARTGRWCWGGHPAVGDRLTLSVPPAAMDRGLFGELGLQPLSLLSPCVLHYPNLPTRLAHIQVFVCCPSTVAVARAPAFLQELPAHLDCRALGLRALRRSTSKDHMPSGGTVYAVEELVEELENHEDQRREESLPPLQQRLLMFLLLQHTDPFTVQLSDVVATEVLVERHLEDILNNNRQAVVRALQAEIKKTVKTQNRRKKDQDTLRSAADVILSSSISIVSCSSNLHFRNACLSSMKVCDTHELSTSLRTSLEKVISWRYIPRSRCYSAKEEEHPQSEKATSLEI